MGNPVKQLTLSKSRHANYLSLILLSRWYIASFGYPLRFRSTYMGDGNRASGSWLCMSGVRVCAMFSLFWSFGVLLFCCFLFFVFLFLFFFFHFWSLEEESRSRLHSTRFGKFRRDFHNLHIFSFVSCRLKNQIYKNLIAVHIQI